MLVAAAQRGLAVVLTHVCLSLLQGALQELKIYNDPTLARVQCDDSFTVSTFPKPLVYLPPCSATCASVPLCCKTFPQRYIPLWSKDFVFLFFSILQVLCSVILYGVKPSLLYVSSVSKNIVSIFLCDPRPLQR